MAIEKLYLTDTFRVWAEKFNATIQASNTATANAEEAINKANEALQKAENAAPEKHDSPNDIYGLGSNLNYGHMRGDGITTNGVEGEVIVKDVAIDGNTSDLASNRGLLHTTIYSERTTILDLRRTCNLYFTGANWQTVTDAPFIDDAGATVIAKIHENSSATCGFILAIGHSHSKVYIAIVSENGTPGFKEIILSDTFATTSAPGIVKPDNTTITVKNGVISTKALGTLDGTTVVNNDFNNLTTAGRYFISTVQDTTTNAPINVTADWWFDVFTYGEGSTKKIIQEARMHSTTSSSATSGVANYLARCCTGTTWGPWEYAYTQFAG